MSESIVPEQLRLLRSVTTEDVRYVCVKHLDPQTLEPEVAVDRKVTNQANVTDILSGFRAATPWDFSHPIAERACNVTIVLKSGREIECRMYWDKGDVGRIQFEAWLFFEYRNDLLVRQVIDYGGSG